MYLTEQIANGIGIKATKVLNINEEAEKIIIYGAMSLLQIFYAFLWTTLVSIVFGVFYEAMLFTIVVSVLKKYSGGAHASSPARCVFIGVTMATIVGLAIKLLLIKQNIILVGAIGTLCSVTAFFLIRELSPVDTVSKPIVSIKMRKRLKHNSIIVIYVYYLLMIIDMCFFMVSTNIYFLKAFECIALGTLWQSLTLTKQGINILNKLDHILKKIDFIKSKN